MHSSPLLISGSGMEDILVSALQSRKYKLAKILIRGGHNVNVRTSAGSSPLMIACRLEVNDEDVYEKLQVISKLIERNADVHATDNKGRTALMYAFYSGCKQTVRWLKKIGLHDTIRIQPPRSRKSEEMVWSSFDEVED
ncbi:Hypothetical predicted protein [Mytilus galloprovincialis]|uniref:Uncharacterized protein n=1 Tax=Mytilus galloprovincialis TaxID=29158 RepID=A0A8B6HSR9_MYTGA|nr:Hypothetical predicted protein [Mytilus galloprovincialis]